MANSQQVGVRFDDKEALYARLLGFIEETGMTKATAARTLIERGLNALSQMEVREITAIYTGAHNDAMKKVADHMYESLQEFKEDVNG